MAGATIIDSKALRIRILGPRERLAIGNQHLLTTSTTHLQTLCDVQTFHALVIDALAGLAQLQVDHAHAVAPITMRQSEDASPQGHISVGSRDRPKLIR
jgi:hypothetical protein